MTISSQTRTAGPFTGTGSLVNYPFAFKVFQTSDLLIQQTDTSGNATTWVLGANYTVVLNSDQNASPGGTVTPLAALPAGYTLSITSAVTLTQPASLTNAGGFFPKTIEDAIDRLTILIQQVIVMFTSAIRVPELGSSALVLPPAKSRAGFLLGFDGNGAIAMIASTAQSAAALALNLLSSAGATFVNFLQAGVGAVLRSVQDKLRERVSITDFGASTALADNYPAALAAYNAVSAGATIRVPAGVYNFQTAPVFGSKRVTWIGEGARQSVWNYTGTSTTNDCFTFGDGVSGVNGSRISGIGFSSSTVMTAGNGVRLKGFTRAQLNDVLFDHQDGNGNFWHGVFFDNFDFVVLDKFQARAQQEGVRYSGGSLGNADLFITGGKIGSCMVGLHAGGGAGGVAIDKTDIINNATNVLIDKTITGTPNREHFFSSTVALDTADLTRTATTYNGICMDVQDTGGIIFLDGTWVATAGTLIRFGSTFNGIFKYDGGRLANAFTSYGGDGNAIEITGTLGTYIINGVAFDTVQGTGVICTAGSPNTGVSLRHPSFSNVANLVTNCNAGSATDAHMGRLVGGGSAPFASAVDSSPAQTFYQNATGIGGAMAIGYFAANASNGWLDFCKSRSATLGAHTVVQTNDILGGINFAGSDGTNFISSSRIRAVVRGTPATGDVASRLEFSTTTPGSMIFTARMYLTESGNLIPSQAATYDLGAASTGYWRTVYAQNIVLALPASATPANNGEMTVQLTSNTSLTFKVKGSDGTVRTGSIALA